MSLVLDILHHWDPHIRPGDDLREFFDDVDMIEIVEELESVFEVTLSDDQIENAKTVEDLVACLQ